MQPVQANNAAWGLIFTLVACSYVEPHVGASQTSCGLEMAGSSQTSSGPGYYGSNSASSPSSTCALTNDNPCDACETAHCCATRSACYGDPTCACADMTLDECLDDAETSPDEATSRSKCWNAFGAKGTVEQARVACERAWCQTECEVP